MGVGAPRPRAVVDLGRDTGTASGPRRPVAGRLPIQPVTPATAAGRWPRDEANPLHCRLLPRRGQHGGEHDRVSQRWACRFLGRCRAPPGGAPETIQQLYPALSLEEVYGAVPTTGPIGMTLISI